MNEQRGLTQIAWYKLVVDDHGPFEGKPRWVGSFVGDKDEDALRPDEDLDISPGGLPEGSLVIVYTPEE